MLKKDGFQFKNILSGGYEINEDVPVVLNKKTMGDGSVKVVYAQYTNTTITVTFGNMNGIDVKNYYEKLIDGQYEYWSKTTRGYKSANFIVEKSQIKLNNSNNGEIWDDFSVTLTKSSEVV